MKVRRRVPRFASETQEAKWWDDNRQMVEKNLLDALADKSAGRATALRLSREARPAGAASIRIPVDEIDRARRLAQKKGISYQTLIKMLLREALAREEGATTKGTRAPVQKRTG